MNLGVVFLSPWCNCLAVKYSSKVTISEEVVQHDDFLLQCDSIPDITDLLTLNSDGESWLPIRRVDLQGWRWLSGEFYEQQQRTVVSTGSERNCAVLRAADQIIDDVSCFNNYTYYICQGAGKCNSKSSQKCFSYGNDTFSIYKQATKLSWYKAQQKCSERKQVLASLEKDSRTQLLKLIQDTLEKAANVWIGLRRKEFLLQPGNESLAGYQWHSFQASGGRGEDCVVQKHPSANETFWWAENCNASHAYPCLITSLAGHNETDNSGRHTGRQRFSLLVLVLIGVAMFVTLVALVVVVVVIVHKVRRKKKTKKIDESLPEQQPLRMKEIHVDTSKHEVDDTDAGVSREIRAPVEVEGKENSHASDSDDAKRVPVERMPKRKHHGKRKIKEFRQMLTSESKISSECMTWLAWNLADYIVNMNIVEGPTELYRELKVPPEKSYPGEYGQSEHLVMVLQDWWGKRDKATAWRDLQMIIKTKLKFLHRWLNEIKDQNAQNA